MGPNYPLREGVAVRDYRKATGYSGRKDRPHLRATERAYFNEPADGVRAIRRAKQWLRNKSKGPNDRPPRHIFQNAELAAFQFGDAITGA